MKSCECGCGAEFAERDDRGRVRRFVRGHGATGGKVGHAVSAETRAKIAATKRGALNPAWRGGAAKYAAIHTWLHRNVQKTGACLDCGAVGRTEWANISGEYKRGRDDYRELCVRCHRRFDKERKREPSTTSA